MSCKGEWQRRHNKPVSESWLREAYLEKNMNTTEIAYIVKRDPKSVWNWLKGFGIPTRSRGYGQPLNWIKKGDPSMFYGHKHTNKTKMRLRDIASADGRLAWRKNNPPSMLGVTGPDHPGWKGGLTPERQAFYSSEKWKKCVKSIWRRDDAKCRRCCLDHRNIRRGHPRFHIHHIDSFMIRSRRAVLSNLLLVCGPCHRWIHSKKNIMGDYLCKSH